MRRLPLMLVLALCVTEGPVTQLDSAAEGRRLWEAEVARLAAVLKALPSDVEKTTFLRQYTGGLIDIGRLDSRTKRRYQSVDFKSFDPAEFYPLFEADRLPAECGITTFFYIKLLHMFGFKAYQYSFGFTVKPYERFIHSVALVEVDVRGRKRLIVQDPYLNLTYRTGNAERVGEPFGFFELLSAIKRKEYDRIVMDAGSVMTSLLVPDLSLYVPDLSEPCRALMSGTLARSDGSVRTKLPVSRDYATLMQSSCGGFERGFVDALHQNGFFEPFIYAYTLRASEMVGSSDREHVQQQIDSVLR